MDSELNKEFIDMVEFLRSKRKARKDIDIAQKTGYNKSQVSNYLNGRVAVSKPFMKKFTEVYADDLVDVNENKVSIKDNTSEMRERILDLKEQIKWQQNNFDQLLNLYRELKDSLATLSGNRDVSSMKTSSTKR